MDHPREGPVHCMHITPLCILRTNTLHENVPYSRTGAPYLIFMDEHSDSAVIVAEGTSLSNAQPPTRWTRGCLLKRQMPSRYLRHCASAAYCRHLRKSRLHQFSFLYQNFCSETHSIPFPAMPSSVIGWQSTHKGALTSTLPARLGHDISAPSASSRPTIYSSPAECVTSHDTTMACYVPET